MLGCKRVRDLSGVTSKKGESFNKRFVKKNVRMRLIESINAITSWENYEYQGHVALYIAIKNI